MGESTLVEHAIEILSYGAAGVVGLVIKLAWDKIKGIEKRAGELDSRADSLEKNYIRRFEDMQSHMTNVKEEIVGKINDLRVCLAESYVKKSDLAHIKTKSLKEK